MTTESATTSAAQLVRYNVLHGDMSVTVSVTCVLEDMCATKNVAPTAFCTGCVAVVRSPRCRTTLIARHSPLEFTWVIQLQPVTLLRSGLALQSSRRPLRPIPSGLEVR